MNNQELKQEADLITKVIKAVGVELAVHPKEIIRRKRLQVDVQNARSVVWKVLDEYLHYSVVANAFGLSPEAVRQSNVRANDLMANNGEYFQTFKKVLEAHKAELLRISKLH